MAQKPSGERIMSRLDDLQRFYQILSRLKDNLGETKKLDVANGHMKWPQRGVYFFFEPGEERAQPGNGPRVVRVGTHALTTPNQTTLWGRLHQHQGTIHNGGGNHRGSIFRLHVGTALINRGEWPDEITSTWGKGSSAPVEVRHAELPLEQAVSHHIRKMAFLWLNVEDAPGPGSLRGYIERNAIALLSNYNAGEKPLDPPSASWLGHYAGREYIRKSGLWNVNHVVEDYDSAFLEVMESLVNII